MNKEFGWNDELIEIKCPKCNGYEYNCIEAEFEDTTEDVFVICCCRNCGARFNMRYVAANIELEKEDY